MDDLWRHGIHDVAHQCDRGDDGCGLVDESLVVASDRYTWLGTCLLVNAIVVVTLGESKEQRYKEGHHHQPVRYPDVCGDTTNQHTHHETYGDNRYVEDGVLLQLQTVGNVH